MLTGTAIRNAEPREKPYKVSDSQDTTVCDA